MIDYLFTETELAKLNQNCGEEDEKFEDKIDFGNSMIHNKFKIRKEKDFHLGIDFKSSL